MAPKRNTKLLSIWDEAAVAPIFSSNKAKLKHAIKMWKWMYSNLDCDDVLNVPMDLWHTPKKSAEELKSRFHYFTTKIVEENVSSRGDTIKLVIELQDGHKIETVIMKHPDYSTVCVSSQIGCQMGCKFCATGTMGIIGDLNAGEIMEQYIHASRITPIRNVVFMGMGEPLNNFENVKLAVQFLVDSKRIALAARQVTVSTVGVVKNMMRLTNELPGVSLALSLHAPTQEVRLKIVPAAASHHITKLMDAVDYHIEKNINPNRMGKNRNSMNVMIEYILIKNINDLPEHAHLLGQLLASRRDHILLNLIPYNPTEVNEDFESPTQENIKQFYDILITEPYRIFTRTRHEMGQDIAGACGQLVVKRNKDTANTSNVNVRDIEDYPGVSTSTSKRGNNIAKEKYTKNNVKSQTTRDGSDDVVSEVIPANVQSVTSTSKPFTFKVFNWGSLSFSYSDVLLFGTLSSLSLMFCMGMNRTRNISSFWSTFFPVTISVSANKK